MIPNKECSVVMKPAELDTPSGRIPTFTGILKRRINIKSPLVFSSGTTFNRAAWEPQHLYFTSYEVVEAGDWFILSDGEFKGELREVISGARQKEAKVVATTDPDLKLLSIPVEYILAYIENYNAEAIIDKVKLKTGQVGNNNTENGEWAPTGYMLTPSMSNEVIILREPKYTVKIEDLLDVIHFAVIKEYGKNEIILTELQQILAKLKSGQLKNAPVEEIALFRSIVANSYKEIFEK